MADRCTVLIVDVERARLESLGRHARAAGFLVSTASCFTTARQAIRTAPPDVLVSALPLAAHNGLHLAIVAGQDRPDSAAVIFSEEACPGSASDIESVSVRMVVADQLLEPQFWRELAGRGEPGVAIASDTGRATA